MTKFTFVALLICFTVSPAFGQYGGGTTFSFLNDADLQMQIRFKSPQGSFYDKVRSLTNGRAEEFELLPGWRAIAEFPGTYYQGVDLNVASGASFHAKIRGNQPHISSKLSPIVNPEPRKPAGRQSIQFHNDTNMRILLTIAPKAPAVGVQHRWLGAGEKTDIDYSSGQSISARFNNGIELNIPQPNGSSAGRFYQSAAGFHYEHTSRPQPVQPSAPQDVSLTERAALEFGITVQNFGSNSRITSVTRGSFADQMRLQQGDTITDMEVVSAQSPWGNSGAYLNAFTIRNNAGYEMRINLKASGKEIFIP